MTKGSDLSENGNQKKRTSGQLEVDSPQAARMLIGERGANLKMVEKRVGARISNRGNRFIFSGEPDAVDLAQRVMDQLHGLVSRGYTIYKEDIQKTLDMVMNNRQADVPAVFMDNISIPSSSKQISPKSEGQKEYVDSIREDTIVFAIGPAGTGKTYLAVAMAMSALLNREFKRIVLTRPAVEAGEKLGFLPGDIAEKVNPYLRPLYDALEDMVDVERVRKFIERGTIEIAPLAFMRGRTLNDSFVILDEAQNTTPEQMKMFLTRLGFNSKAVVTGDTTQVDLGPDKQSGLLHAAELLGEIEGIGVRRLYSRDVVRHPLVARIVDAYDGLDAASRAAENGPPRPEKAKE